MLNTLVQNSCVQRLLATSSRAYSECISSKPARTPQRMDPDATDVHHDLARVFAAVRLRLEAVDIETRSICTGGVCSTRATNACYGRPEAK